MIIKKIAVGILILLSLNGCAQNVALLGPAYTMVSSGNVYQAGLTYGSNEVIVKSTGKSTAENIQELLTIKEKDNKFEKLVKRRIKETRKKLSISSQ